VAVGGALTEIVYALGAEAALVGVDTTSQHPASATDLPQVGYQRNLSPEGILSLSPDLLLVTADAGPPEVLDQVRGAGIEILALPTGHDVNGVLDRVDTLAQRFDRVEGGQRLAMRIEQRMEALQQRVKAQTTRPKALFLLGASPGSAMAAGSDTAADAMLRLAGADNVFENIDGYKAVGAESLIAAAPDAIVVVAHGASDASDIIADTLRLLGFGPRIDEAAQDLFDALHADAAETIETPSLATLPR